MRTIIVLPAYNEAPVISAVIADIHQHGFKDIIVVDDGSADDTAARARQASALVIRHRFNRGKGAAVKTGMAAATLFNADIVVTMDADGQHQASDISALSAPIAAKQCDVVLGTREWHSTTIPRPKALGNFIANGITWAVHGQWVADSQSGFRAYSRRAMHVISPQADYYDFDSEVIREIRRHHLRFTEVPITVRYTTYSQAKLTRQTFASGLKTAYRMLWQLIA